MPSITAANAVIMMALPLVFPVPQPIQGFMADDVFGTDPMHPTEVSRGVDGKLSGGYVYSEIKQTFSLQADSPSNFFFDQWFLQQVALRDTLTANAVILLTSLGSKWIMTKGFLVDYPVIPDAKKLLVGRKFAIQWESVTPAPV